MFRASALRQSDWRNCGLCAGWNAENGATLSVNTMTRKQEYDFLALLLGKFLQAWHGPRCEICGLKNSKARSQRDYLLYSPTDAEPQFL